MEEERVPTLFCAASRRALGRGRAVLGAVSKRRVESRPASNRTARSGKRSYIYLNLGWAQEDSNLQPTSYASHHSFRCPFRVCGLDSLFTPVGYLPSSLYTFISLRRRLARDYPALADVGFPEFDRFSATGLLL